jgi:hypothetical protein
MSSYQTSPNQFWNQPAFAAQPQPQPQHNSLSEDEEQALDFGDQLSSLPPTQGQGQARVPHPPGFYHAQTYPIQYSPNHSQLHPHETAQTAFVSGHINPSSGSFGSNSGTQHHRSLSFGSAPSEIRAIDPLFPINYGSSYSASDYTTYGVNSKPLSFDHIEADGLNQEGLYAMSPEAVSGYPSPPNIQSWAKSQSQQSGSTYSNSKRVRPNDDIDNKDVEGEPEQAEENGKAKNPRACVRCKTLKVKCEFKSNKDPCKKCLNGGHACQIPGKKPRRTPPKREHLMNQIRDQASEIQRLLAELEEVNKSVRAGRSGYRLGGGPRDDSPNGSASHSPGYATSSIYESHSYFSDGHSNASARESPNKDVLDWMAKARESLEAFGGYIGIGGAGVPKSLLVDEDLEGADNSDDEDEFFGTPPETEAEFEIVVQNPDGKFNSQYPEGLKSLRTKSSDSSIGTTGIRNLSIHQRKKEDNEKSATVPTATSAFGLMAGLAYQTTRKRDNSAEPSEGEPEELVEEGTGIARVDYFKPSLGPGPLEGTIIGGQQQAPHILTRNIITPQEAEKLFTIYFDYMNLSLSLLDPVLYTAQKTCWRSPFLFTVICAIASRFYTERPELYGQVMHYAQLAAGSALISGHKSVETVSAYILLSLYPVPAHRWEEDRSWIYLGLAIRIATDLNLHHPNTAKPINEHHAREMLNRTRVWLNCFNLDRSTSSQYGKTPIIRNTDYIATHSEEWYESSEYNMENFDIHLATYNAELRLVFDFVGKVYSDPNHPTGLNKEVDFEQLATETDDALVSLSEKWFAKIDRTDLSIPQNCFRTGLLKLAFSYARLIALSYGFQHSFGKSDTDENPFLQRCLRAATDVVNCVVDDIGRPSQRIYLRHGPEAQSVFVTFACAFLVKLLQPKFASYLSREQRLEIRRQVQRVIDLLGSPEVAIDNRHGPKLYSRFLKGLLATPMAKIDFSGEGTAQPRRTRRRKSATSETDRQYYTNSGGSNHTSPATSHSLSPPPESTLAIPFDQFAPVTGGIDPLLPLSEITRAFIAPMDMNQDMQGLNMLTNDFFRPPLPFDDEILQNMRELSDPIWGDLSAPLPGFSWINQYQHNDNSFMKPDDMMTFDDQYGFNDHIQM